MNMNQFSKRVYSKIFATFVIFCIILMILKKDVTRKVPLKISTVNSDVYLKTKITESGINKSLKYILLWTNPKTVPFMYMLEGRKVFLKRKCPYTNCYVTSDRTLLGDYRKFDVIAFSGPQLIQEQPKLPTKRSIHQKYAFASIESPNYYPICDESYNNFFNWTWTYKLDSDAKWGYIVVRDKNNTIIGPEKTMHWLEIDDMEPIERNVLEKINKKSKGVAWFVSNCLTPSSRENYFDLLKEQLLQYSIYIDIYGLCGQMRCPRFHMNDCLDMLERDYYFYLAFENALSEDYVTEKILHALNHYTVPVVYGGADYSRFLPNGIYLNAMDMDPSHLAKKIYYLMNNPKEYQKYFRWHNHYKFHRRIDSIETDDYCRFCSMLNDEKLVKETTIYKNFKTWWTPSYIC